jgi:hypothetical protein
LAARSVAKSNPGPSPRDATKKLSVLCTRRPMYAPRAIIRTEYVSSSGRWYVTRTGRA